MTKDSSPPAHHGLSTSIGGDEQWLPLLEISKGMSLGRSTTGRWLVGIGGTLVPVLSGVEVMGLLERPLAEVVLELRTALHECGLPGGLVDEAPFALAVEAALVSGMDYWAALALTWLDALPRTGRLLQLLDAISHAPWASQGTRHAAKQACRDRA